MDDPVRTYLNSVLECRVEIKRLRRKIDTLESRALNVTSQLTGMPRGGNSDRDAVLAALADATGEYYKRLAAAERRELEVSEFIDSIPDQMQRVILRLRYLDRKSWTKIRASLKANGVDVTERRVFQLHGEALNSARHKYKEMYPDDEN